MRLKKNPPKSLAVFIWHSIKPYKILFLFYLISILLFGIFDPIRLLLNKYIIDALPVAKIGNIYPLIWSIIASIGFFILSIISRLIQAQIEYRLEQSIKNNIIKESFEKILKKSFAFFQGDLSGRISDQIVKLSHNIHLILFNILPNFLMAFAQVCSVLLITYSINITFFYIFIAIFFSYTLITILTSRRIIDLSLNHAHKESTASGKIVDSIQNYSSILFFNRQNYEMNLVKITLNDVLQAFKSRKGFEIKLNLAQSLVIVIMISLLCYFLIKFYLQDLITVGDFVPILGISVGSLNIMVYHGANTLQFLNNTIGQCQQSLNTLFSEDIILDSQDSKDLVISQGRIIFDSVEFKYKNSTSLFKNLSFTIEGGQKVAFVGHSGSGKTSTINLLLRFYDLNSGSILIDDQNIKYVTQKSLRENISLISQSNSLFQRSIMENIRYGKIIATEQEVIEAAKIANIHDFIMTLPEHYNTLIGNSKLSGGQAQRIMIARAILKNAPILIIDEGTSQLDSENENIIQNNLSQVIKNKTTIIISHKLSTIIKMDRILVFDNGEIVAHGTHEELLKNNQKYQKLWQNSYVD